MLLKEQFFVFENHGIYKNRLKYQNINYERAYLKNRLTILYKEEISNSYFTEYQHIDLSHCIMQIRSYKEFFFLKTEDERFSIKEKW